MSPSGMKVDIYVSFFRGSDSNVVENYIHVIIFSIFDWDIKAIVWRVHLIYLGVGMENPCSRSPINLEIESDEL